MVAFDDGTNLFSEVFNPLWMDEMSAPKNLGHTQLIAERPLSICIKALSEEQFQSK